MRLALFYFVTLFHLNLVSRNDARLIQAKKNIKEPNEVNQTTVNYHKVRQAHDNSEHKLHYLDHSGSIQVIHVGSGNARIRRFMKPQLNVKDSRGKVNNENNSKPPSKQVFVNKPIPKLKDEEDEDTAEVNDSKGSRIFDSFEHEDEDFSLNDYEFDTNHDEFSGKENVQVPIIKKPLKESDKRDQGSSFEAKSKVLTSKEARPLKHIPASNEVKKANSSGKKYKSEEYYDDATKKHTKDKSSKQESSAAVDDSKEQVKRPIRTVTMYCEKDKRHLKEGKMPFQNVLTLFPYIRH